MSAPKNMPKTIPKNIPKNMEVARKYLAAIFDVRETPGILQRAYEFAEPGSDAAHYVQFQVDHAIAVRDAGLAPRGPGPHATFRVRKTSITTCRGEATDCAHYSEFEFDGKGRVRTFSVEGEPVGPRLVAGTPVGEALGASFRLAAAYETAGGSLVVVGRLEARQPGLTVGTAAASYIGLTGRQVASDPAAEVRPQGDLRSGTYQTVSLTFRASAVGGQLRIPVTSANPAVTATIEVPIA